MYKYDMKVIWIMEQMVLQFLLTIEITYYILYMYFFLLSIIYKLGSVISKKNMGHIYVCWHQLWG